VNTKLVYTIAVLILFIGMIGLTFSVSRNPLYAAMMGGLVCLFGWLTLNAATRTQT
jgi:hypothetical protein